MSKSIKQTTQQPSQPHSKEFRRAVGFPLVSHWFSIGFIGFGWPEKFTNPKNCGLGRGDCPKFFFCFEIQSEPIGFSICFPLVPLVRGRGVSPRGGLSQLGPGSVELSIGFMCGWGGNLPNAAFLNVMNIKKHKPMKPDVKHSEGALRVGDRLPRGRMPPPLKAMLLMHLLSGVAA